MNKTQLLSNLASRTNVLSLVGTPLDVTPSGDVGVVKWYQQGLWQKNGDAAVKQSITFYVANEDTANEVAYYKDAEPTFDTVRRSALKDWMRGIIDANPDNYKGVQVHWINERWEMVVYSLLEDDGSGGLKWQAYYVRKGAGAAKKISNHEASRLSSQFNV